MKRNSTVEQIPALLRLNGPLTSTQIVEALAMEQLKVFRALWNFGRSGVLVVTEWRMGIDPAGRQKLYRVYGVAGVHEAADPAAKERMKALHGVGLTRDQKPKRNYTYPPGSILPKSQPRVRRKSGSGHIAGPAYHRGSKWFVDYR